MAIAPLTDDVHKMSYTQLKERVRVLTRRVNSLTQMRIAIVGGDKKPTITITEESSILQLPDSAALVTQITELETQITELEQEITDLESENDALQEENEELNSILDGSCWTRECVETRDSGVCGNSVSTATATLCYTGLNGSNLHTFYLNTVRVQEGGNGYTCGSKISMYVTVAGWGGGGDDSGTITVPANRDGALFDITYSWSAFGGPTITNEKIGQIFLPDNGGAPTFYPPFQDSNT